MISALLMKAQPLLTALKSAIGMVGKSSGSSLAAITKNARVEPVTLVDKALTHQPWLTDVLLAANSIFTGYYLQAIALTAEVNGVKSGRQLESLSPSRNNGVRPVLQNAIATHLSGESQAMLDPCSYTFGLPSVGMEALTTGPVDMAAVINDAHERALAEDDARTDSAVERLAAKEKAESDAKAKEKEASEERARKNTYAINSKAYDSLAEASNLSVGRMFEVSLSRDGVTTKIPVMVRLITSIIDSDVMAHILGAGGRNVKILDRYHAWRAGQLSFIRDIVLMQDLIDSHKQTLAKDNSGAYKEVSKRASDNALGALTSGLVSHATASNIAIISARTAKTIESITKRRFRDAALVNMLFDRGYLLIMIVIDEEMERVTFYHRGVALPTQLSLRELKAANKNSGPDVQEIMKSFMLGQQIRP